MPVAQKGLLLRLKPKNDFVLIKRIEEHASSVIQTPDQYKQRGDKAVVIAVGDARIVGSLLVPIDDVAALATAIRRLIEEPGLAKKLAEAGRAAYEADYVEAKIVKSYLAFYEALIKTR